MRPKTLGILITTTVVAVTAVVVSLAPERREFHREEEKTSGAMQALDFWAAHRAYPDPVIPDVGFFAGYEATQQMRSRGYGIDDLVAPWETLGPTNMGGRTLALAFDPDDPTIIYAGSASGALWRTTTGGVGADAWDYVETGFPVLSVSSIAIQPGNRNVIYIGTGEVYRYQNAIGGTVIRTTRGSYGIGILKTTNGGMTWTQSLDWSAQQRRGVWRVRIHPSDPNIVYAATTEGVYRSDDAGASWTRVHDVVMATDLRIHPTNPEIVFAACGNFSSAGHGIYRSLNGGVTWEKLTGLPSSWSGKAMLEISASSPNTLYASIGNDSSTRGLFRSTNLGDTWSLLSSVNYAQYQGWYSHWVIVNPEDPDELFVGGIDVWRSLNGGSSLERRSDWNAWYFGTVPPGGPEGPADYVHADNHIAVYHPTDRDIVYFGTDGGVFRTTDGGERFEGLNGGYQTTQFYNGFSTSMTDPERAMGGLQDNCTVLYEGHPELAWRREIGGDGFWTAINPLNSQTVYGEYYYLNMLRSRNGGDSWTSIAPPEQAGDQSAFSSPYVLSPSDPNVLYAGRSRVYKSTNEGTNWAATNAGLPLDGSNPALSMAVSANSPDTVYAATAPIFSRARLFRTDTGGDYWDDITSTLPDRYPSDLAVDYHNANVVYAAFSGFGTSHLFKSTDGGYSWIDIGTDLPDVPTSAVETDPDFPDVVYAGNDLGVYVSIDGGLAWEPFMRGMPTAMVSDLKVSFPTRTLRASTHGNGVYERDLLDPGILGADGGVSAPPALGLGLRVEPNPLQARSRVSFHLREGGHTRISLFDVSGRRVAVLADRTLERGSHSLPLDPANLTSGVYYVRLQTSAGTTATRVVHVR